MPEEKKPEVTEFMKRQRFQGWKPGSKGYDPEKAEAALLEEAPQEAPEATEAEAPQASPPQAPRTPGS